MRHHNCFRTVSILLVMTWFVLFVFIPIVMMLLTSFLTTDLHTLVSLPVTLKNYHRLGEWMYVRVFYRSLVTATLCTLICLFIGYPFAFMVSRAERKYRALLLLFVIIPFWTSSMIRTFAIMTVIKAHGILNNLLIALHIIDRPLMILYSNVAVYVGLVYALLPFMILPLYANLEKLDNNLIEAAKDLGAGRVYTFIKVIIPASLSGIMAGVLMVFLPAMTLFYIPTILGGAKSLLLGNIIQMQYLDLSDWPMGAAISVMLVLLMAALLILYRRLSRDKTATQGLL